MADYRMRADYRGMAPEVAPVQLNPTIGIYQEGFGREIANLGAGAAMFLENRAEGQLKFQEAQREHQNSLVIAEAFRSDIDQTIAGVASSVQAELGRDLTPDEAAGFRRGLVKESLLKEAGLQNPRRMMFNLSRAANYRSMIAANPTLAPEINEAFRVGGGVNPLAALTSDIESTDDVYDSQVKFINEKSLEYGLDPNLPIEVRAKTIAQVIKDKIDLSISNLDRFEIAGPGFLNFFVS
jgi:hypothetical protein